MVGLVALRQASSSQRDELHQSCRRGAMSRATRGWSRPNPQPEWLCYTRSILAMQDSCRYLTTVMHERS